ncbi:MAG: hypothetical protein AB7G75_09635 [Candidatus Binatia bacterium]
MRNIDLMTLAAVGGDVTRHRMLAVALAAVLCHLDSTDAFLQAGQARPD